MAARYPIPILTIPFVRPKAQIVPVATIQLWARRTGNVHAHRTDMAGITVPSILADFSNVDDEYRNHQGVNEFRYKSGRLVIYLRQRVFISSKLSPCEQRLWTTHEFLHVHDNELVMGQLLDKLQDDLQMISYFGLKQWMPQEMYQIIINDLKRACARVFRELTVKAVKKRDTHTEYHRVRTLIRQQCGGRVRRPTLRHSRRNAPKLPKQR